MPRRCLLTGSELSSLESQTFQNLSERVSGHPESVLYLTEDNHPREPTRDRWNKVGPSAALRIETLDGVVSDWFERDQFKGRVTHIDRPLLARLVELGVEGISSPGNPLHTGGRLPRAGLVQEAEDLFTNLEFAGLLSAEAMRDRLRCEGLDEQAEHVAELAAEVQAAREEILADELPETYRTERMHHVTESTTSPSEAFPSVEAVVVGGITGFEAIEREFLRRIADEWPTIALLPLQTDTDMAVGVDTGAQQALRTYLDLGFSRSHIDDRPTESTAARRRVAQSLYRHPEQSPDTEDVDISTLGVQIFEPATIPEEIRGVARELRYRIANGTSPDEVGVVLTNPVQYSEQLRETFTRYELPFTVQTPVPLSETALGDVVLTICDLAERPWSVDSVLNLLTNPLVAVADRSGQLDHRELTRVAAKTETRRLETVLEYTDDAVTATISSLLSDVESLSDEPLSSLTDRLEALLERLGVSGALAGEREITESVLKQEQYAADLLDRGLETLALTDPVADASLGTSVDRLERAVHGLSLNDSVQERTGTVTVCGLKEALSRDFDHVYVLGLTASHVPSERDQSAFVKPIYEAHPDFEQPDLSAEARYHLGALLGSSCSLHLSVPQRSLGGDEFVEAELITELRRLFDLNPITSGTTDGQPGSAEDVQQSLGTYLKDADVERTHTLVDEAVDAGTFTEAHCQRIKNGIACGAARAAPHLTPYDGQLSAEMVSRVHGTAEREPYSASRLETYATCGFKYYMKRVLGIEAPDSLTREPNAADRGSYLHDVFEHYYLALQATEGEAVDPAGDSEEREALLLEVALSHLGSTFDEDEQTAFHDEWMTKVLGGLGSPEDNPYFGPDETTEDGRPIARGLLYRFLEHEFDEPARATARPSWFEARVGSPHSGGTSVQDDPAVIDTPEGPVPIHGLIDRVETVPGTEPVQLVVRDYKTGSNIPSESDALLGVKLQLPLYALMAEDAFDGVETVGGAYYQVSPPSSVNSRKGLLTSQEMASYYRNDEVNTPLLRYSYPHLETHTAFRRFIEETTTQRLGTLATSISDGRFHPTVLDPSDAGCRYCDYADVCDVRPHQRRHVMAHIDDEDLTAYVPPKARDLAPEDIVEVQ